VNKYGDGQEPPIIPAPDFSALEQDQVARLAAVRASRDGAAVQQALARIAEAAPHYLPDHAGPRAELMPRIIDAVRVRASVGEIADTLEQAWGRYQPSSH
jgi:methylmalonyl-CoA mutase N-terminal domain/subunit